MPAIISGPAAFRGLPVKAGGVTRDEVELLALQGMSRRHVYQFPWITISFMVKFDALCQITHCKHTLYSYFLVLFSQSNFANVLR